MFEFCCKCWPYLSHISLAHISKSKRCFNVKSSRYYFHVKTKILVNFQIRISVPLTFFLIQETIPQWSIVKNLSLFLEMHQINLLLQQKNFFINKIMSFTYSHISEQSKDKSPLPANSYLFQVKNRNTRKICKIFWQWRVKTTERLLLHSFF